MPLPFPNVPPYPGVPQLPRALGGFTSLLTDSSGNYVKDSTGAFIASGLVPFPPVLTAALSVATTPGVLWQSAQTQPTWGIYLANSSGQPTGDPLLVPDSFVSFDHDQEFDLPSYPVQAGSFASYNKVRRPFEIALVMRKGGTLFDRALFLSSLDTLAASLQLLVIVTPEQNYSNVNIYRPRIVRSSEKDAFYLTDVEIYLREIRQITASYATTAVPNTTNAQNPSAQPTTNQGIVQAQSPDATSQAAANTALTGPP